MWCPPTPPTSDDDVYIDYSLGFLYDNTPMSEAQLPPIYVRKDQKRSRVDTGSTDRDGKIMFTLLRLYTCVCSITLSANTSSDIKHIKQLPFNNFYKIE